MGNILGTVLPRVNTHLHIDEQGESWMVKELCMIMSFSLIQFEAEDATKWIPNVNKHTGPTVDAPTH
jgi:hypothetical protein